MIDKHQMAGVATVCFVALVGIGVTGCQHGGRDSGHNQSRSSESQSGPETYGIERKQPDTPQQAGSQGQQGLKSPGTPMEKDEHGGDKLLDDTRKSK